MHYICACIFLVLIAIPSYSQCDSLRQVQMKIDTMFAVKQDGTLDKTNYVLSNELTPYYYYEYQQDSATVTYRIGEFSWNNNWLHLEWCDQKSYNFDVQGDSARWDYTNAQLSAISRTHTFSVGGGDTLGFYREMFWYDKTTSSFNANHYSSADDLAFSVELVDANNGQRVMLLDSMSLQSSGSSTPCMYVLRPVIARIGHVVPSNVSSFDGYVRVNLYSSNSTDNAFIRTDDLTLALSKSHLDDAGWKQYASNVAAANNCNQSCSFGVSSQSSPRQIQVTVNTGQTAVDRIDVVDINGNLVQSTSLPTTSPFTVSLGSSGIYIVPGYKNGAVVCTQLVTVQ